MIKRTSPVLFLFVFFIHVWETFALDFLDMPIVNVGTASNLFDALKLSLSNHGLDFSKCLAFMSDTTNAEAALANFRWSGQEVGVA